MEFIAGELRRLKDLRAADLLTDAEHDDLKKKVLERGVNHASGAEKDLADHFVNESLRKHQVWRNSYEDFLVQEAAYKDEDLAMKQEAFLNMAKAGHVTPLERMLSFYSLYGTVADHKFFQSLIATVPDDRRVEYHNWYVARACGDAFLAQHGNDIAAGVPPLFGPQKEFGPFNVALMKQSREVHGAGPNHQGCFDTTEHFTQSKVLYAAGYAIPIDNGFVDIGIVEEAINWLDKRVKELEAAMQEKIPAPQYPRPQQQPHYAQRGRGGYSQGRGGRYRGGRGYDRGGYDRGGRGSYGRGYQGNW